LLALALSATGIYAQAPDANSPGEVFERYFKKYYKADSCDCIILPDSVKVYKYIIDKATSLDSLVYTPQTSYQSETAFVPVVDVGKRIVYVDVESNRNILTYPRITEIIIRHDGFIVKAELSRFLSEESFEDFDGNIIETAIGESLFDK